MKAKEIMTSEHIWSCSSLCDAREAASIMAEHDIGSLPVLDEQGRLEGMVTDRDICCRVVAQGRSYETPISEVMSYPVQAVHEQASLKEVQEIMETYKIRRVPVVDQDRRLLGFISMADIAHNCHGLLKEHQLAELLESVSTPD